MVEPPKGMKTPEQLLAEAQEGVTYEQQAADPAPPVYEPGELVCSLTLDEKQAWLLLVLLGPWKNAPTPEEWEFVHAAYDIRRRIAEAMGVQ
jgi:hypothetical protein